MKDIFITIGSIGITYLGYFNLGNLSAFNWWQHILIWFYLVVVGIFGGFFIYFFEIFIVKPIIKWKTGEQKLQKKY